MKYFFCALSFSCFTLCLFHIQGQVPTKKPGERSTVTLVTDDSFPLTTGKDFFVYENGYIDLSAQRIEVAIRSFDYTTRTVEKLLSNDSDEPMALNHLPAWGGLYSNMPLLTGRKDAVNPIAPPYMLSLMYRSKFKEAERVGQKILEKDPDNYGALVLLGLLSIYNEKNFPYLERAFIMNPYRTIWIFDWHCREFRITSPKQWDFADAFFRMLSRHNDQLRHIELSFVCTNRLYKGFSQKYGDPYEKSTKTAVGPDMIRMIHIIRGNFERPQKKE